MNQICPQCGEDNPTDAVMCWHCYEVFQPDKVTPDQLRAVQDVKNQVLPPPDKPVRQFLRWFFGQKSRRDPVFMDDLSPIQRIATTILLYALADGAKQIRLAPGVRGVPVEYQIAGEWRDQMKIPFYCWADLRSHFVDLGGDDKLFLFEHEEHRGVFRLEIVVAQQHEILLLHLLP